MKQSYIETTVAVIMVDYDYELIVLYHNVNYCELLFIYFTLSNIL